MSYSWRMSVADRFAYGVSLRQRVPLAEHGDWLEAPFGRDAIELIEQQNANRIDYLVPVRRARMSVSPFTFYRGSARIMAADLARTPNSGLSCQICGDAHLANFGAYASPERNLVVDVNDFDETLLGPWEWDVKRLCASLYIACLHNGLSTEQAREMTERCARAYRKGMAKLADMRLMDCWNTRVDMQQILEQLQDHQAHDAFAQSFKKAKKRDSLHALDRLAEEVEGEYRIISEPPLLIPFRDLGAQRSHYSRLRDGMQAFHSYLQSLPHKYQHLLSRYKPVDFALKVVGVGSVGTRCYVMMLEGRDRHDPLFLQIKQANPSVLEEYLTPSPYASSGERVVEGQRLMQTMSDIFLGHCIDNNSGVHFYWRQLKDWKGAMNVDALTAAELHALAKMRGWTLARAHARSADAVAISGYLDDGKNFDRAIVRYAERYQRQNVTDYHEFIDRINSGELAIDRSVLVKG